jgi:phosphatidate cytidylyltransferase
MNVPFCLSLDSVARDTLFILAGFFLAAGVGVFLYELKKGAPDENLRKRYLSWYMIAPVVLIPAYFGGLPFAVLVCAMALYCLREFFNVVHVWDTEAYKWVGRVSGVALVATALFESTPLPPKLQGLASASAGLPLKTDVSLFHALHPFYILPVFIIMLVLTIPIFMQTYEGMLMKEAFTILGILYFGWFLGHLVFLRELQGGFGYIIFLSMTVVFNDVLAYTVGRLCGKTPLTPKISPKKTREGAAGGLIGSLLAALIFRYAVPELSLPVVLGAALIIGVAAPLGDLIISVIKRDMAVKDSGNLIPGHGGLLDRCDSLIFATPAFYYFLLLAMNFR